MHFLSANVAYGNTRTAAAHLPANQVMFQQRLQWVYSPGYGSWHLITHLSNTRFWKNWNKLLDLTCVQMLCWLREEKWQ